MGWPIHIRSELLKQHLPFEEVRKVRAKQELGVIYRHLLSSYGIEDRKEAVAKLNCPEVLKN